MNAGFRLERRADSLHRLGQIRSRGDDDFRLGLGPEQGREKDQ